MADDGVNRLKEENKSDDSAAEWKPNRTRDCAADTKTDLNGIRSEEPTGN